MFFSSAARKNLSGHCNDILHSSHDRQGCFAISFGDAAKKAAPLTVEILTRLPLVSDQRYPNNSPFALFNLVDYL